MAELRVDVERALRSARRLLSYATTREERIRQSARIDKFEAWLRAHPRDRHRTASGEVVFHRVVRSTGATVEVERAGENSTVGPVEPGRIEWWTVCVDHGSCVGHASRSLAVMFASHPEEWCEDCQRIVAAALPTFSGVAQ